MGKKLLFLILTLVVGDRAGTPTTHKVQHKEPVKIVYTAAPSCIVDFYPVEEPVSSVIERSPYMKIKPKKLIEAKNSIAKVK
jgi:hypothetical protein